ncbi:MAG: biosynthetic-type acetolactate synthase large subunit [Solobacterium sp.]|nr:biosynthetic-type acetolactate synthase large subunit [Solobacterium sp.]
MKLTGSEIFVEVLVEQGVDTLFGYPGGAVLNLYDELYRNQDRIHHYMSAHEQGASHAADGYARATGKTGVVLATSGPGATNLVTGIATAYMDSVPMVAFTGNVGTGGLGKDSFQEAYIEGITMPITKHNYTVRRIEDLADTMREAFRIAQSGRKGPVLVDIPKDISAAVTEFEPKEPVRPEVIDTYDTEQLKKAAELLGSAKRPVIYFGGGVISSEAEEPLKAVMEKADIPATWTLMAKGILDDEDPLNLGLIGMHGKFVSNKAIDSADVILAVGTRFSDRVALNPAKFARSAKIIQFDIDASEVDKNVEVDCSVVGDANVVLRAFLELLPEADHTEWHKQITEWKEKDYRPYDSETALKPHQILQKVCELSGDDSIYVTDVGQHQMWAAQYLTHVKPRHFLTSGGLGTMGYGYGAAIGAQIAKGKEQRVIHLTGDGSFHMNLNEGVTAVSYDLPVITVIFNNQVLGMVRQWQTLLYGKRYSSTDPHRKTNYVKLAEGFGAKGWHCETLQEFEEAFKEALNNPGPSWIECVIDKDEKVLPMIPAGATIEDIILADGKEA